MLDVLVWTGQGSPTLEQRHKRLPELLQTRGRPIDAAFAHTIFTRDYPGTAEDEVVEAFARAILELDDSVPNGTCIDMCQNLPLVDPRRLTLPVLITRSSLASGAAGPGVSGRVDRRAPWRPGTSAGPHHVEADILA